MKINVFILLIRVAKIIFFLGHFKKLAKAQTLPGITWTTSTSAADNEWRAVTYGNGLFVAVATSGTNNRVMSSPDGITWTIRTSPADNQWYGLTYGLNLAKVMIITTDLISSTMMQGTNTSSHRHECECECLQLRIEVNCCK
jgi:hypothetical protein